MQWLFWFENDAVQTLRWGRLLVIYSAQRSALFFTKYRFAFRSCMSEVRTDTVGRAAIVTGATDCPKTLSLGTEESSCPVFER